MLSRFLPGFSGFLCAFAFLAGPYPTYAAQPASTQNSIVLPTSAHERTIACQQFATERLAFWQKRLHLEEWNITVEMARTSQLRPKTLGNIHWDLDSKTALIHVMDPADYHMADQAMLDDMEFTVVHELIHLSMAPVLADLQRTDANRRQEEHAVNHVADALLKLERAK